MANSESLRETWAIVWWRLSEALERFQSGPHRTVNQSKLRAFKRLNRHLHGRQSHCYEHQLSLCKWDSCEWGKNRMVSVEEGKSSSGRDVDGEQVFVSDFNLKPVTIKLIHNFQLISHLINANDVGRAIASFPPLHHVMCVDSQLIPISTFIGDCRSIVVVAQVRKIGRNTSEAVRSQGLMHLIEGNFGVKRTKKSSKLQRPSISMGAPVEFKSHS